MKSSLWRLLSLTGVAPGDRGLVTFDREVWGSADASVDATVRVERRESGVPSQWPSRVDDSDAMYD
jgi:hypothetical protein